MFGLDRFGSPLQRGVDRLCVGPLYRGLVRRQERRILKLAEQADVAYLVGVPSANLHERLCELPALKVVMDVVDALWLPYHQQFGWDQFDAMIARADGVTCKSEGIAAYVRTRNSNAFVIPDSPQLPAFDNQRRAVRPDSDRVTLAWVGSPDATPSLNLLHGVLEQLAERFSRLSLTILGADARRLAQFEKLKYRLVEPYDRERMVRELLAADIGLFPLAEDEDSRVRGASKARLYMSAGIAAACQNLGENAALIDDGVNGVLAASDDEWMEKLGRLIDDATLRRSVADRGLELIRREYSPERCFQRLVDAFDTM